MNDSEKLLLRFYLEFGEKALRLNQRDLYYKYKRGHDFWIELYGFRVRYSPETDTLIPEVKITDTSDWTVLTDVMFRKKLIGPEKILDWLLSGILEKTIEHYGL